MVDTAMIIHKDFNRKLKRDYFFITGKFDIDCNYFIEKIKKGCEDKSNRNFQTHIKGNMTSFTYFLKDPILRKHLLQMIAHLDKHEYDLPMYQLAEAWGFETRFGGKTRFHSHAGAIVAGVIYFSECNQPLIFKEIDEKVYPAPGVFALFTPWLNHGCEISFDERSKFGVSFNMLEAFDW